MWRVWHRLLRRPRRSAWEPAATCIAHPSPNPTAPRSSAQAWLLAGCPLAVNRNPMPHVPLNPRAPRKPHVSGCRQHLRGDFCLLEHARSHPCLRSRPLPCVTAPGRRRRKPASRQLMNGSFRANKYGFLTHRTAVALQRVRTALRTMLLMQPLTAAGRTDPRRTSLAYWCCNLPALVMLIGLRGCSCWAAL